MSTLLMQFVAPLQSWGTQSNFTNRDSGLEPSKSGVIGIVCAAMGKPRNAEISDLAHLRMGVRVDREGTLQRDFHIVQDVLQADGKKTKDSIITNRYYLSNAVFLVGLEGEAGLLMAIDAALHNPVWQIYLGRKAFVPSTPLFLADGFNPDASLEELLFTYPSLVEYRGKNPPPEQLRVVLEDLDGEQIRNDQPISFQNRTFVARRVSTHMIKAPGMQTEESV